MLNNVELIYESNWVCRLQSGDKGRVVIRNITGGQVICFALQGRDHLDRIFKILAIQVKSLNKRVLVSEGNLQELQ